MAFLGSAGALPVLQALQQVIDLAKLVQDPDKLQEIHNSILQEIEYSSLAKAKADEQVSKIQVESDELTQREKHLQDKEEELNKSIQLYSIKLTNLDQRQEDLIIVENEQKKFQNDFTEEVTRIKKEQAKVASEFISKITKSQQELDKREAEITRKEDKVTLREISYEKAKEALDKKIAKISQAVGNS